jgi:Arc/MetJ family transcription regulator
MKTTIEIADDLLARARRRARRQRTTLRAVIEDSLRRALAEPVAPAGFRLKKHSFKGDGRDPAFAEGRWDAVRDEIHRLG